MLCFQFLNNTKKGWGGSSSSSLELNIAWNIWTDELDEQGGQLDDQFDKLVS